MEQPSRVRAKAIIDSIRECMLSNLEEIFKFTLVPARYIIHLHPDDYDNLKGFFSVIKKGASHALNDYLAELNGAVQSAGGLTGKLTGWWRGKPEEMKYERAGTDWEIEFIVDYSDEAIPGLHAIETLIDIDSRTDNIEGGSKTIRVLHRQTAEGTKQTREELEKQRVYAQISYEDLEGRKSYQMTKAKIRIGRGSSSDWVDLKLVAPEDVSREHIQMRYQSANRQFEIKDLSSLGTWINGQRVTSSAGIDEMTGNKRDLDIWEPLPPQAQISLAGMIFLDFTAAEA